MYRTVAQLDTLTETLATSYPSYFQRFTLPETSVEGRSVYGLRMRVGDGPERRGVLIVGGTHARELMNPDAIAELAIDLLDAHRNGTDITYGAKVWPHAVIDTVLRCLDVYLVPCINPDGRDYVLTVDDMWRKNRRPGSGFCDGVDLNRNADILWGVTQGQTSCSPCSAVYCGPSMHSEPEGRNVRYLMDTHRMVTFLDVHSFSELMLWPWGHAENQSTNPAMNFTTLATGTCRTIPTRNYREYLDPRDALRHKDVGARVVEAIAAVRGRSYTNQAALVLYPTTGAQSDAAYARHLIDPGKHKTYGFTLETGPDVGDVAESFHPKDPTLIKIDAKSGMIELLRQSICAIELIGTSLDGATTVDRLATARDTFLATTEAGRAWISLIERVQYALAAAVLTDAACAEGAAKAFARAGVITGTPESEMVTDDDIALAKDLAAQVLAQPGDAQLSADMSALTRRLGELRGSPFTAIVESLMAKPPKSSARNTKRKSAT